MPRTASPAVSVIVPLIARADLLERAGSQLRSQTLTDFEVILVGGGESSDRIASLRSDERVRREGAGSETCEALNAGLDACRGERVMIFDPRDEMMPHALEALAVRMRHGGESGAFGGFRFRAPIGDLPQDPLADAPDSVGFDELAHRQWFPLSMMMVDAGAIGGIRFRAVEGIGDLFHPSDYEWLLRLAEVGVCWSRSRLEIGRAWVRRLERPCAIERSLKARTRMIRDRMIARGHDSTEIRSLTQSAVDACLGLRSDCDNPPTLYCDASNRSTAEMARWWQRTGFVGRAPEHLNPFAHATISNDTASGRARRALESLDPCRPVVIVGTGSVAPMLAGTLASLGMRPRICGIHRELPGWSGDARAILLEDGRDAPPRSQFVLTEADVHVRLPAGVSIVSVDEFAKAPVADKPALADDGSMPAVPEACGVFTLPALIRAFIREAIDPSKPVALLGLGRNARLLARDLERGGIHMHGVDSGVQGLPWWADVDEIRSLIACDLSSLPPESQLVMTVLKDDRFVEIIRSERPASRILRWSLVADVLAGVRSTPWESPHTEHTEIPVREAA